MSSTHDINQSIELEINPEKSKANQLEDIPLLSKADTENPFERSKIEKLSNSQEFFNIENLPFWEFTKFTFREGLPASMCFSDYNICNMVFRIFLSFNPNVGLNAATGFAYEYFAIMNQAVTFGVIEV
jgi:hypothetical protein